MIQKFFEWMPIVIAAVTLISVFILAPLGIFRVTRSFAGVCLVAVSWVFGASLWIYGALVTFSYWGLIGLIIGLVVFGIGVVPMGFIAVFLQSQWELLLNLLMLLASMIGARFLGIWYVVKSDKEPKDAYE